MSHFENKLASVDFDSNLRCVRIVYHGFSQPDLSKELWAKAVETAIQFKSNVWFLDMLDFKGAQPEYLDWFTDEFIPKSFDTLQKVGITSKRMVVILLAKQFLGEMQAKKAVSKVAQLIGEDTFNAVFFHDRAEAEKFLKNR
jgi:hypothetical protein